ncbi:hypothetical protein [Laspinema olomoucense]|uniref:hypothetical protein n=1 Tax=Laspinema olomoucense TaxID=3231600 RepID=UPI0021BAAD66|nr:hypothetical protein [Laspinema sp. D3a]MCT7988255.1 hypothetical protein [Laspinema sp. D3a]
MKTRSVKPGGYTNEARLRGLRKKIDLRQPDLGLAVEGRCHSPFNLERVTYHPSSAGELRRISNNN